MRASVLHPRTCHREHVGRHHAHLGYAARSHTPPTKHGKADQRKVSDARKNLYRVPVVANIRQALLLINAIPHAVYTQIPPSRFPVSAKPLRVDIGYWCVQWEHSPAIS